MGWVGWAEGPKPMGQVGSGRVDAVMGRVRLGQVEILNLRAIFILDLVIIGINYK